MRAITAVRVSHTARTWWCTHDDTPANVRTGAMCAVRATRAGVCLLSTIGSTPVGGEVAMSTANVASILIIVRLFLFWVCFDLFRVQEFQIWFLGIPALFSWIPH